MWAALAVIHVAMSLATFVAYGIDKRRAEQNRRRVPEATLHALELCFGYPGGFAGQRVFRHKTRKLSYQVVFWAIVALHALAWVAWMRQG